MKIFLIPILFLTFIIFPSVLSYSYEWRKIENNAFKKNEKIEYIVRWGSIVIGYVTAELSKQNEKIQDRKCYRLTIETRSYPFFDLIYKVRNIDESLIDQESICSLRYEKHQREAGIVKDEVVFFDHPNQKFFIQEKNEEGSIPPFVNDPISSVYYFRTQDIEVGKEYIFEVYDDKKIIPIKVSVYKKEKIKLPIGESECFLTEPIATEKFEGVFKAKGRIFIWFTADEKKIPVRMESKILIGSVIAEAFSIE